MNGLPRAILLDLDDTIIDDSGAADSIWTAVCAEAAGRVPGLAAEVLRASIQEVREWYWRDPSRAREGRQDLRKATTWIVGEAMRKLGLEPGALAAEIANRYRDMRDEAQCLLPGALEALDRMRALGLRLALLTNGGGAGQRAKVVRFGLEPYFDYICIEGEFGWGKPDERVYNSALSALDASPAEAWMAGDNLEFDVAAPMRLGLTGIWVDRYGTGLPEVSPVKPDRIVIALAEVLDP
jgi:putative hydrolase of the HAD superfamily